MSVMTLLLSGRHPQIGERFVEVVPSNRGGLLCQNNAPPAPRAERPRAELPAARTVNGASRAEQHEKESPPAVRSSPSWKGTSGSVLEAALRLAVARVKDAMGHQRFGIL
jgi:hypothetical protein